jgi:hypothetical protein
MSTNETLVAALDAQDDLVRAIGAIAQFHIPLNAAGLIETEWRLRQSGTKGKALWQDAGYMKQTARTAQAVVAAARGVPYEP